MFDSVAPARTAAGLHCIAVAGYFLMHGPFGVFPTPIVP